MVLIVYICHCYLRAVTLNHKAKSSYVDLNLFARSSQFPKQAHKQVSKIDCLGKYLLR